MAASVTLDAASGTVGAETRRVLFVSSNGAGMGHLTRLMAMARRCSPLVRPSFASMSSAVPVVGGEGYAYEYIPSRDDLGIGPRRWNLQLGRRLTEIVERVRPAALVFDGTYPYDGLFTARRAVPDMALIWSRRGMWRRGAGKDQLARSARFDLVVEPGELARDADPGLTAARDDALRVGPVTLLDGADLVSREDAAAALGVDPERPTALLTMGAGTINDLTSDLGVLATRLLAEPDLQVVLTRPMIAADTGGHGERVHGVSLYPISRYLAAVDFAVAASGYNSFHELVGFGVPTAFVPNTSTALDDQQARAAWAERAGVGLCVPVVDPPSVDRAVRVLADPAQRDALARRCRALAEPNGAGPAMAAVEQLLGVTTGRSR